ncbi:MAG TPA: hypothetical protein O0X70_06210 [Methanocorpusculum sp.]|nr:hypothetical protein [Methanocorpusculum sp.]
MGGDCAKGIQSFVSVLTKNAVVHNDYSRGLSPVVEIFSDRVEITSAGGLPDDLGEEEFFKGYSSPRNRELMRVFRDLGLVEHLGNGMGKILSRYDRSIFVITPHFLKVVFRFNSAAENGKSVLPDGERAPGEGESVHLNGERAQGDGESVHLKGEREPVDG